MTRFVLAECGGCHKKGAYLSRHLDWWTVRCRYCKRFQIAEAHVWRTLADAAAALAEAPS